MRAATRKRMMTESTREKIIRIMALVLVSRAVCPANCRQPEVVCSVAPPP